MATGESCQRVASSQRDRSRHGSSLSDPVGVAGSLSPAPGSVQPALSQFEVVRAACDARDMAKRPTRPRDANQLAKFIVDRSVGDVREDERPTDAEISKVMAELGRRGGKIGGKRRMETASSSTRMAFGESGLTAGIPLPLLPAAWQSNATGPRRETHRRTSLRAVFL